VERVRADSQSIGYYASRKQQGTQLQGHTDYDTPDKVMNKNDLLVGERFQHKQIFQRMLLQDKPLAE
jgi:hypothetical protein